MSGIISRVNNDIIETYQGQDAQGDVGDTSFMSALAEKANQTDLNGLMTVNLKVTNSNDITQDLINAITTINNNGGGVLNIPYLSSGYTIIAGSINLCNNLIINGNGNTFRITSSSTAHYVFLFNGLSNITIRDLNFVSTNNQTRANGRAGQGSNVYGIALQGTNISLQNLYFEQLENGIWLNNTINSKNLYVNNIRTYQTKQPIFMKYITDSVFTNLYMDNTNGTDPYDHHIYINGLVDNVIFDRITALNGISQSISLKNDVTANLNTNLVFTNIKIVNAIGMYISYSQNITVRNYHAENTSNTTDYGIDMNGAPNQNITLDNFFINGYGNAIALAGTSFSDVFIKNGYATNYTGNALSMTAISNLCIDNVTFKGNCLNSSNRIFYSPIGGANQATIRNCKLIFNTTPNNDCMSLRGSDTVILTGCEFLNYGSTYAYITYNLSPAVVTAKNNYYHGFTAFKYSGDTGTTEYTNVAI